MLIDAVIAGFLNASIYMYIRRKVCDVRWPQKCEFGH
jgi:hypothetical protein